MAEAICWLDLVVVVPAITSASGTHHRQPHGEQPGGRGTEKKKSITVSRRTATWQRNRKRKKELPKVWVNGIPSYSHQQLLAVDGLLLLRITFVRECARVLLFRKIDFVVHSEWKGDG